MSTQVIIIAKGGLPQVLKRVNPLCSLIRSKYPSAEKVYVSFQPSLFSQLDNSSVAGWTRVCNTFYSKLGTIADICVQFTDVQKKPAEFIDMDQLSDDVKTEDITALPTDRLYSNVCMGGTFDRLHAGHKILLSTALLRTSRSLTVGVTAPSLLVNKSLTELIAPLSDRIKGVQDFLSSVNSNVEYKVVEIQDPFGPAIVDPTLECIVGSSETVKGCMAVNEKRKERGMSELDVHIIELVQDAHREGDHEEAKVSSSSLRARFLGHRLRGATSPWDRTKGPYIIGLTGGSASGKSSVGQRLEALGAGLVDCDKLGHAAYLPGSPTLQKIVDQFGSSVLNEDGTINRPALGGIVFSDRSKLEELNSIVWPEISRMAMEKAGQAWKAGVEVVVLDAAVLLEADWDKACHEVWVCTIPRTEAVKRIVERDNKTAEEAEKRLNSQKSNEQRCKAANTIFCTLWDKDVTQKQVVSAWTRLAKELGLQAKS